MLNCEFQPFVCKPLNKSADYFVIRQIDSYIRQRKSICIEIAEINRKNIQMPDILYKFAAYLQDWTNYMTLSGIESASLIRNIAIIFCIQRAGFRVQ